MYSSLPKYYSIILAPLWSDVAVDWARGQGGGAAERGRERAIGHMAWQEKRRVATPRRISPACQGDSDAPRRRRGYHLLVPPPAPPRFLASSGKSPHSGFRAAPAVPCPNCPGSSSRRTSPCDAVITWLCALPFARVSTYVHIRSGCSGRDGGRGINKPARALNSRLSYRPSGDYCGGGRGSCFLPG
jgi:hypothetical protein